METVIGFLRSMSYDNPAGYAVRCYAWERPAFLWNLIALDKIWDDLYNH